MPSKKQVICKLQSKDLKLCVPTYFGESQTPLQTNGMAAIPKISYQKIYPKNTDKLESTNLFGKFQKISFQISENKFQKLQIGVVYFGQQTACNAPVRWLKYKTDMNTI